MKRYQWIGIILFLPILFLWTSASTHAAPLAAYSLPEGRTYDQAHNTGYIDWSGSAQYVYITHRDGSRKVEHFVVPIVPSGSRGWAMVALPADPLTVMFHTSRSWSALRLTQVWAMPCCGHVPLWIHGTCRQALDSQGL